MSRYRIPSKDKTHETYVGWDNPLQTYFAQVIDENVDKEWVIFWVGGVPGEVSTVHSLEESLKEYADIPLDIKEKLQVDFNKRTEPTPLQKLGMKLFKEAMEREK